MLLYHDLNLDNKPDFDRLFELVQPDVSDLTFTNLFMWQSIYGLKVHYDSSLDYWIVLAKPGRWKPFFLPPVGDWSDESKLKTVYGLMKKSAIDEDFQWLMRRQPKHLAERFLNFDSELTIKNDRNTFDYLYRVDDLIHLRGRNLHAKRNHLNKFLRLYQWEYCSITPEILEECLELETEWFNIKTGLSGEPDDEEIAMAQVLKNYDRLCLTGGVIRINGKIQALTVGEKLNNQTFVIHIEKANIEYEGIYVAMNQQFLANEVSLFEYVNREEDMGIDGLRQAKLSYRPARMVEKCIVLKSE